MSFTRKLISIEIQTPTHVYSRSVISNADPKQEDLLYYYTTLCGLTDATVSFRGLDIPDEFNEALLATIDRAPTKFPAHDLETEILDVEKRRQYTNFITQLCEMEHSRAALRVFVRSDAHTISVGDERRNVRLDSTRNWVNELLRSLNEDHEYEIHRESELIVAPEKDTFTPIGWIFTPVVHAIREDRGSRIVMDPTIGSYWEKLLGTDIYPDLVVGRRISTLNWAFQHSTSDALVRATMDWYLAAQDANLEGGVSGWIPEADREITALFSTFKRIKVHERLIMEGLPKTSDKNGQVFTILSSVESRLLASSLEIPEISACSYDLLHKYMTYVFRGFGIAKEVYVGNIAVHQILLRWSRASLGFRGNVDPLLESWKDMWTVAMRGKPTAERVHHFLRTLDCWDPLEAALLSPQQKTAIAHDWIHSYIDNEIIAEDKARERSTTLHAQTKDWCLKYVPVSVFPTNFNPMQIGPLFTKRGFNSVKRGDGRHTLGLRFKHVPQESVKTAVTSIIEEASNSPKQNTVVHMFRDDEIHLGTL